MRFVCESCRAQYMINDDKVGPKGVKVRCRKCGYVITVKRAESKAAVQPPQAPVTLTAAPLASTSDNDDGMATQVMQTPLGANGEIEADATSPGLNATTAPALSPVDKARDSFLGADEDEIGAVFDQVLKTGPTVTKEVAEAVGSGMEDDRQSTRVLDAETVAQLARESGTSVDAAKEKPPEPVPDSNWFVAINEKQTGPLTLEKVKEHWDHGEIGPDSLCWREGYGDWIPLSEVKALASVLAPKPPRPIVVPATVIPTSVPSVVSVPVQSAFSAGGVMQTVQSEMQVPIAAGSSSVADREESGSWRPSAASALASLVKDEMAALAKPAKVAPPVVEEPMGHGLLDVPEEKPPTVIVQQPQAAPKPEVVRAPTNPYLANPGATYSAPGMSQYRPPSNRGLILGLAIGGVLVVLALVGLVIWVVSRSPSVVVQAPAPVAVQPVAVAQPPVTPPPATTKAPEPAPVPAPVAAAPAPVPAASPQPNPAGAAPVVANPSPPAAVVAAAPKQLAPVRREDRRGAERPAKAAPEPAAAAEPPPAPAKKGSGDDDFESAFGGNPKATKKETVKEEQPKAKKEVLIPPAPGGGGEVKESLGQSDIMEVVLANKGALTKCASEQRQKEPDLSGKLVMKWTVQTSGKVTNVTVVTEEFKSTYMAGCVGGLIKGWVFPRHKVQGEPIQFPFKF